MKQNAIAICLAVVVVALLVVGAVTGLVFRHIVQVLPAAALLVFSPSVRGSRTARCRCR